jgi:hypothetical protein
MICQFRVVCMNRLTRCTGLILIGLLLGFTSGCKKSGDDPKVLEAASQLPGAADVMAAINKKDYDGAMAALMKVKQTLTTEDQNVQFMVLARQARDKMDEAASTNAQAAEAAITLRAMTTGGR